MTIRWDPLLVRAVAQELHESLRGARLRAVRLDAETRDLVLLFRRHTLLWRLHPDRGLPLLRDPSEPQEGDLRLKARVRAVRSPPDERVLVFEVVADRTGPFDIVIELLGNQMNAMVVEGDSRTIRHVLRRREGRRPARVGIPYQPPPPTGRKGVDGALTLPQWIEMLEPVPPPDREKELVRTVAWASPLNAATFLGASLPEDAPEPEAMAMPSRDAVDTGSNRDLASGWTRWRLRVAQPTSTELRLLEAENGLQPYPFPLAGYGSRRTPSLLAAFEAAALDSGAAGDAEAAISVGPQLLARLEDAVDQALRRSVRLRAELDQQESPEALRSLGDLILARYGEIVPGSDRATLSDFDGEETEVELDPSLAVHENATRYYDRAARSERASRRLPGLIDEAEASVRRLRGLLEGARSGETGAEAVRAALPEVSRRSGQDRSEGLPYRTYRSSGGLEIRVGRGARHNDALTFHHSAPNDVWMHARHVGGAHVILRWSGEGAPPERDLHEAGTLAALHSKARTSGSVPVDWTRRKYVRKPRGSAPGAVVPDRVSTIFVHPEEALRDRLADGV